MQKKLIELLMQAFTLNEKDAEIASMKSVSEWDSLTHVELMMSIEEEFNISKITPDEMVMMTDIENIRKVLTNKNVKF
jgi:acyl carrier protein